MKASFSIQLTVCQSTSQGKSKFPGRSKGQKVHGLCHEVYMSLEDTEADSYSNRNDVTVFVSQTKMLDKHGSCMFNIKHCSD